MTVWRFLSIFYRHAQRFENFRRGRGLSPEEQVALQKRADALNADL